MFLPNYSTCKYDFPRQAFTKCHKWKIGNDYWVLPVHQVMRIDSGKIRDISRTSTAYISIIFFNFLQRGKLPRFHFEQRIS